MCWCRHSPNACSRCGVMSAVQRPNRPPRPKRAVGPYQVAHLRVCACTKLRTGRSDAQPTPNRTIRNARPGRGRAAHVAGQRSVNVRRSTRESHRVGYDVPAEHRDPAQVPPPRDDACTALSAGSGSVDATRTRPVCRSPSLRSATASISTTARSWEMNRHAKPISCCRSLNRSSTRACTDTSSAEVGSSAISSFGRSASARAMPTRCR